MNAFAPAPPSWATTMHAGAKALFAFALFAPLAFGAPAVSLAAAVVAALLVVSVRVPRRLLALLWLLPFLPVNALAFAWLFGAKAGIALAALVAVRVAGALAMAMWFAATTSPRQLLTALHRFPRASLALSAVMRGALALPEEAEAFRDAVALRGLSRTKAARAALPALLVRTARRGETLGVALHASGFGGARRIAYAREAWRARDSWLVVAGIALAVGGLLL